MKGKEQEKNVRTSKVQYSSRPFHKRNGLLHTRGYTYFPRISIARLWLEELGFHVGDKLQLSMGKVIYILARQMSVWFANNQIIRTQRKPRLRGKPPERKGGRKYSERFKRTVGKVAETEYRH